MQQAQALPRFHPIGERSETVLASHPLVVFGHSTPSVVHPTCLHLATLLAHKVKSGQFRSVLGHVNPGKISA